MIKIDEENNSELYYENLPACLDFCKSINDDVNINHHTDFHVFWNVGLPFGRKQLLNLKSYLCTQDLKKTKYNLWCNIDITNNQQLRPFLPYINFKIYDPYKEVKGTVLENRMELLQAQDDRNWAKGDLFRLLVLHNYGGVYTDVDVAFLRNFAPLLEQEFMYKWGREKNMINGAIMHMFKGSQLSKQLLFEISRGYSAPGTTIWSTNLYERVRSYNKNWTVFPSGFFNSEWQDINVDVWNPMKKYEYSNYEGSFSWHWHNKWNDDIEVDSKWYSIEQKFNNIIREKFPKINF